MTDKEQHFSRQGLGAWNLYFIFKFALLFSGVLNFHPLLNVGFMALWLYGFMAFLLVPTDKYFLRQSRNIIALPVGGALFYHDTWLPGIHSILRQYDQVASFSFSYLVELADRFINWRMLLIAFIIWVVYLLIHQWLRVTTFVICWMGFIIYSSVQRPSAPLDLSPAAPNVEPVIALDTKK